MTRQLTGKVLERLCSKDRESSLLPSLTTIISVVVLGTTSAISRNKAERFLASFLAGKTTLTSNWCIRIFGKSSNDVHFKC